MTQAQRIIRNLAIAFAIFLVVAIFGGILSVGSLLAKWSSDDKPGDAPTTSGLTLDEPDTVTKLDIELAAAELTICRGDALTVAIESEYISCRLNGSTLGVEEREHNWFVNQTAGKVVITLPEGHVFGNIEISTGAGKLTAEGLVAERSADIDGGAGEIVITDSVLHDLDLDLGVGELTLKAAVTGDSSIDFGVGEASITLDGTADDYTIRMDKGLGSATLDGEEMRNATKYGDGANRLELDGGVGAVRIDFAE